MSACDRPMVCLARVLREEETLCGRRRRPRPSEADDEEEEEEVEVERAYLALHLLKKGAAGRSAAPPIHVLRPGSS